ncbi:MAG: 50S ribosomal protein L10 [Anaerolineales bacterium]|nr:50S ribosomal protein L10 [Anaerolineales bacterium]
MAITREQKEKLVAQYKDILNRNTALIFTEYSGLSVKELEELRGRIREIGGEFYVVKNTLAKRAIEDIGLPQLEGGLDGPTAIGVTDEDVTGLAKAIVDLARATKVVQVKGAVIDGEIFDSARVKILAALPPMPVIQAQLLSVLQAPASQIARALSGSVRQVVSVVKAYSEKEAAAA